MTIASFHHDASVYAEVLRAKEAAIPRPRTTVVDRDLAYRFQAHFHPWVGELVHELVERSVRGLQAADTAYDRDAPALPDGRPRPRLYEELLTAERYDPSDLVLQRRLVKELDFSVEGAYAVYNWELFYHVPITIAVHLSRNQRFEEAQRWFHYVFDPTDSGTDPAPERFWKVLPFHSADVQMIEAVLANLSTGEDPELLERTVSSIEAWKDAPFRPHLVARYRQSAYMIKAVTAYLDNLISWGDALFRQDTGESVNEATQLYVLAANILGPRPQEVPRKGWQRPQTYASLRAGLDAFSNALTEVEVDIPFDVLPHPTGAAADAPLSTLRNLAGALYFCVPRNDRLLGYWDTVADRLFKVRNSLNVKGIFRRLPLFEPSIDPALLAKAAAAGLDTGAIIAGLSQPLPLVRFGVLVAKATEVCQEVKSLGAELLAAIEKEDAEALTILRTRHERVVLGLAEVVRYQQWQEAIKSREAVERSFAGAVARYTYYERLLGKQEGEIEIAELEALDASAMAKLRFSSREPVVGHRPVEVDIAADLSGAEGRLVSSHEARGLDQLWDAQLLEDVAGTLAAGAARAGLVPQFEAASKPMGAGAGIHFGGVNLNVAASAASAVSRIFAARTSFAASLSAKVGSYARREQEWAFQSNAAADEITQTYKQWRAAQIREAMAEREWRNHQQQIRQAEEIEQFLTDERTGKTSNRDLYAWLRREVRGLYGQCFQFALDVARKAERALLHEVGDPTRTFVRAGYQAGKQGLLAGERLYLDVKRMEMAYHELNQREYELTKHVSLRQLDPLALLRLRATGTCEFTLPEESFDLDCPGHYFRRIKAVGLSIPCVVGPYAGVNATLTLQRSTVRTSAALPGGPDGYVRDGEDAGRFSDHFGGVQSIVTSTGNQDGGLFEMNLHDERYLPFEGSGAVSVWRLELPAELPQFDHDTISDVVLHLRYTARQGGTALRTAAAAHHRELFEQVGGVGSARLLSVRHEFPTAFARFTAVELNASTVEAPLTITLREEHYPFWASAFDSIALRRVDLLVEPRPSTKETVIVATAPAGDGARTEHPLVSNAAMGGLRVGALADPLPPATGEVTLFLDDNSMDDVWLVLGWGAT